nr:MAG TPA: hypothetical protein [Caudoviricetes sp.]
MGEGCCSLPFFYALVDPLSSNFRFDLSGSMKSGIVILKGDYNDRTKQ